MFFTRILKPFSDLNKIQLKKISSRDFLTSGAFTPWKHSFKFDTPEEVFMLSKIILYIDPIITQIGINGFFTCISRVSLRFDL